MRYPSDPVRDAEAVQDEWNRPDRDGIVTITMSVSFRATGRTEEELSDMAYEKMKQLMKSPDVVEWDWDKIRAEFEESED